MPASRSHAGQNSVPDSHKPAASTTSLRICNCRCSHDQRGCVPVGIFGDQRKNAACASRPIGTASTANTTVAHHHVGCDDGPAPHSHCTSPAPSAPTHRAHSQTSAVNGNATNGACTKRRPSSTTV